jgi:tetratricopeptide (TPR) repeat protein
LPAVLAVLALFAVASLSRKRRPAFSAALLFFFCGHLLESTLVPLELYFEHRNYVPAMLLGWPLARVICVARWPPVPRLALACLLLAVLAATTLQRAALWGKPEQLASLWALKNPGSSRAQATLAMFDTGAGHPDRAIVRLGPLWRQRPGDLQVALNYVNARCAQGGIDAADLGLLRAGLRQASTGHQLLMTWLERAVESAEAGRCRGLDLDAMDSLVAAAAANPGFRRDGEVGIWHLRGRLALAAARPAQAKAAFDRALRLRPSPDAAARQASLLAVHGYYHQALAHLDLYESIRGQVGAPGRGMPRLHAWVLERQGYWNTEMRVLREKLGSEIGHQ